MAYSNLPAVHPTFQDGNLTVVNRNDNPVVVILGTAAKGDATIVYDVASTADATSAYGRTEGTLIKGMFEAYQGGARSLKLVRVGSTAAKLEDIGTGITLETLERDEKAGQNYKLYFDDSIGRLKVWRVSDDLLIYDNNPAYPTGAVDLFEVSVTGTWTTGSGDIGTLASPLTMELADGEGGASYTAGTDGIQLSRMELFEALYKGYKMLENEEMDIVVPQDVYLDDLNTSDMTTAEVATLNTSAPWDASSTYPTRGTTYDALGKVFVQEYEGEFYFWWDMDRDGVAEIYPTIGAAGAGTDAFGNSLSLSDFHEANFGYQLANFCYETTEDEMAITGVIGVKPPDSWAPKDVHSWIGRLPTYEEDSSGNLLVTANGTGLLGIKWMNGRLGGSGLPDFSIGGVAALAYGGFIATDTGWPDGTQQTDSNDHLVDIGKYLSIVGAYAIFSNSTSSNAYMSTLAAMYGGFISTFRTNSSPTNKVVPNIRVPFNVRNATLDTLAGARYVFVKNARKGPVIADAPTAARPDSDYQRLLTVNIVKDVVQSIRDKADPFFGEAVLSGVKVAALNTAIDSVLSSKVPDSLERYNMSLTYTTAQKIRGEVTLRLILVPVSELRKIYIELALSA